MKELKARLKQAKRDRTIQIGTMELMDREIAELEEQIADSKVTYSIGDRMIGDRNPVEYRLMRLCCDKVALFLMTSCVQERDGIQVANCHKITESEFKLIMGDRTITRTYDARKQEKC